MADAAYSLALRTRPHSQCHGQSRFLPTLRPELPVLHASCGMTVSCHVLELWTPAPLVLPILSGHAETSSRETTRLRSRPVRHEPDEIGVAHVLEVLVLRRPRATNELQMRYIRLMGDRGCR
jgi:hypothetical protein